MARVAAFWQDLIIAVGVSALGSAWGSSAIADTLLPVNDVGNWTEFQWSSSVSSSVSGANLFDYDTYYNGGSMPPGPVDTAFITSKLTTNTFLKVTDAFYPGDTFTIFVNGKAYGTTTPPCLATTCPTGPTDFWVGPTTSLPSSDPTFFDLAYNDGQFATAEILLTAGQVYTITGVTSNSPLGQGMGGFELVAATPIPATWTLMLVGLLGIGFGAAYRRPRKDSLTTAVV